MFRYSALESTLLLSHSKLGGSKMSIPISTLVKVLRDIEEDLERDSEFLVESGKGVDDPGYGKQTKRLEALMAPLSLAIKELQSRPKPLGPEGQKALKYARNIGRKLKAARERAGTQNTADLLGAAFLNIREYVQMLEELDHVHQYHNPMILVPDHVPSHVGAMQQLDTFQAAMVLLFTIFAGHVQRRKRASAKNA
jgi:hypothetical protein